MKISQILLPLAFAVPALSSGMAAIKWVVQNVPDTGLKQITFPISIAGSPHESRYHFGMQFPFYNNHNIGYVGLQPRPDADGSSIIHAVFSTFALGVRIDDTDHCHEGADGGPGVSCAVEIPADYDHTYDIVIENVIGAAWKGSIVDTTTGKATQIGKWSLPIGTGGIGSSYIGFIQDYVGDVECNERHAASVMFGDPTTTSISNGNGTVKEPYEYGPCPGEANFKSQRTAEDDGIQVTIGW